MNNRLRVGLILLAGLLAVPLFAGLGLFLSGAVFAPHADYSPRLEGPEPALKPLPNPGSPAGGKRK